MRILIICCLLFTLVAVHAATAENWEDAYRLDVNYLDAERAVVTAHDELNKLKADPEAAPLALTRAQEKLDETQARLRQAKVDATTKAFTALGDVLVDRCKATAATAKLNLAALQLDAANVRKQAGMISEQELARTLADNAQATVSLATAKRELLGAEARAKLYISKIPDALPAPPEIEAEKVTLGDHPQLLTARHKLSEAERALALAQGPDTAPLDLEARKRELQSAQDAFHDTERSLTEALAAARRRYLAALESEHLATDSLKLAQTDLATAQKRYQNGAVSRLTQQQSEAAKLDAASSYEQAHTELWLARIALVQAAGGAL